jgi:hypothetical protein
VTDLKRFRDVKNMGILCTVDLFPIPDSVVDNHLIYEPSPTGQTNYLEDLQSQELTFFPLHPHSTVQPGCSYPPFRMSRRQEQAMLSCYPSRPVQDVVLRIRNLLVTESSKLTPALVGEKFVEPVHIDHQGKKSLVFVFTVCPRSSHLKKSADLTIGPGSAARRKLYFPLSSIRHLLVR